MTSAWRADWSRSLLRHHIHHAGLESRKGEGAIRARTYRINSAQLTTQLLHHAVGGSLPPCEVRCGVQQRPLGLGREGKKRGRNRSSAPSAVLCGFRMGSLASQASTERPGQRHTISGTARPAPRLPEDKPRICPVPCAR